MFNITRLIRSQARHLQKSIHTTSLLRNPETNPTVNLLNSTSTLGRHRSKLKRNKALTTLPETFLSTNYLKHASLGPLPSKYSQFITDSVWKELEFSVRSGLAPKGAMASFNHTDHLVLNVSDPGACYLQDHIVRQLAAKVKADLLVLDPQDLVFLAQHSFSRDAATLLPMLSSIDPNSNAMLALRQSSTVDNDEDDDIIGRGKPGGAVEVFKKDEDEEGYEEDDTDEDVVESDKMKVNVNSKSVEIDFEDLMNDTVNSADDKDSKMHKISKSVLTRVSTKYTAMFKKFLSASEEGKIIYLRDYSGMQDTFNRIMLKSLTVAVEDLKQKGHRLMIVASHSQKFELNEDYLPIIPNMRYLSILPSLGSEQELAQWKSLMKADEASRVTEINAKQVVAMYSQKNVLNLNAEKQGDLLKQLLSMDLSKSIWSPSEVDRRVSAAIGHALSQNKDNIDVHDFKTANQIIKDASELRNNVFFKKLQNTSNSLRIKSDGSVDIDYLKRTCNEYEKKLLSRVVDPAKVQGSFKDVRAPPETVDTLQSLISLPLIRPDLFQKGILKKNFIPGVLLFGPPGTGKTMLAKAVAKDSGSRMLDIQASDVYDMYVGQGEKNVKAIFSLARQLSPCVVFIDEVDSLMNKRGSDYSSKSHREIINQFMVEWDGLSSNNQGIIVMAATNRPFDLDDAVLRRMPRRILVDLPNEKDRVEILKILLQDQEHQVAYEEVAKMTEHYSGSDLKNVCVTAALKAVQQEISTKTPQTLTIEHFKEAIKMIPPSSSEDMDTVVEIRKWDSKFGDGKKKKKPMLGF